MWTGIISWLSWLQARFINTNQYILHMKDTLFEYITFKLLSWQPQGKVKSWPNKEFLINKTLLIYLKLVTGTITSFLVWIFSAVRWLKSMVFMVRFLALWAGLVVVGHKSFVAFSGSLISLFKTISGCKTRKNKLPYSLWIN